MKTIILSFAMIFLSIARADDFSDRQAAARAAADAQYRKDMSDIKASIAPLSRQLIEQMSAPHGGVAKFNIRVTSHWNDSNVYGEVSFSTKSGLACQTVTAIAYTCIGDGPGCPGQLPAAPNADCYDSQNRRMFMGRDGTIR